MWFKNEAGLWKGWRDEIFFECRLNTVAALPAAPGQKRKNKSGPKACCLTYRYQIAFTSLKAAGFKGPSRLLWKWKSSVAVIWQNAFTMLYHTSTNREEADLGGGALRDGGEEAGADGRIQGLIS